MQSRPQSPACLMYLAWPVRPWGRTIFSQHYFNIIYVHALVAAVSIGKLRNLLGITDQSRGASDVTSRFTPALSQITHGRPIGLVSAITSPDRTGAKVYYQSGSDWYQSGPWGRRSPSAVNVHASH